MTSVILVNSNVLTGMTWHTYKAFKCTKVTFPIAVNFHFYSGQPRVQRSQTHFTVKFSAYFQRDVKLNFGFKQLFFMSLFIIFFCHLKASRVFTITTTHLSILMLFFRRLRKAFLRWIFETVCLFMVQT